MSTAKETDYARIARANGDPYRVLGIDRDATTDDVRGAYKRLALLFHPDRIKLPRDDPSDPKQAGVIMELRDMAARTFKDVAWACATLVDPQRRAEWDRVNGLGGALVPYSQQAPHAAAPPPSGYYDDGFDLHGRQPPRRSASAAGYSEPRSYPPPHAAGPPYREPPPYAPPRGREHDMYDDLGLPPFGRGGPPPGGRRGGGGLEDDLFANPFGMFGGSSGMNGAGAGDMFDLGLGGGGKGGGMSNSQMSDPMALFAGFLGGMNGQQQRGGGGGGGNQLSMSPTGVESDDPLARMFSQLSTGGGPGQPGRTGSPGATRGAFASHRITRKHTNRDGDVTISRQERTMAMMDAGPRGQVMVESSFRVVGRQNSGQPSSSSGFAPHSFDGALPSHSAPPHHTPSGRPQRASTMMSGYPQQISSAAGSPFGPPRRQAIEAAPDFRLPALESGRAPMPQSRMIGGGPGMELAPYGGAGQMSRW